MAEVLDMNVNVGWEKVVYLFFASASVGSVLFSRWIDRGTNVRPRVLRRPKLMVEGVESEVLNLVTAETSSSIISFSTSILLEVSSSFSCIACFLWFFCLCFLDGCAFLKNSNDVGNLCLSTRCCFRPL